MTSLSANTVDKANEILDHFDVHKDDFLLHEHCRKGQEILDHSDVHKDDPTKLASDTRPQTRNDSCRESLRNITGTATTSRRRPQSTEHSYLVFFTYLGNFGYFPLYFIPFLCFCIFLTFFPLRFLFISPSLLPYLFIVALIGIVRDWGLDKWCLCVGP